MICEIRAILTLTKIPYLMCTKNPRFPPKSTHHNIKAIFTKDELWKKHIYIKIRPHNLKVLLEV